MMYARDIILGDLRKERGQTLYLFFNKVKKIICKNKMITLTVGLCSVLIGLDFVLIHGFVKLLQML